MDAAQIFNLLVVILIFVLPALLRRKKKVQEEAKKEAQEREYKQKEERNLIKKMPLPPLKKAPPPIKTSPKYSLESDIEHREIHSAIEGRSLELHIGDLETKQLLSERFSESVSEDSAYGLEKKHKGESRKKMLLHKGSLKQAILLKQVLQRPYGDDSFR